MTGRKTSNKKSSSSKKTNSPNVQNGKHLDLSLDQLVELGFPKEFAELFEWADRAHVVSSKFGICPSGIKPDKFKACFASLPSVFYKYLVEDRAGKHTIEFNGAELHKFEHYLIYCLLAPYQALTVAQPAKQAGKSNSSAGNGGRVTLRLKASASMAEKKEAVELARMANPGKDIDIELI